jgi:hypothetical protein
MKLLFSSCDLQEVERVLKQLLWARIGCAVEKDPANSYLNVWIQRGCDLRRAMRIFMERQTPRPLPHWASVLEWAAPAKKRSALPATNAAEGPRVVVMASKEAAGTRTA